MAGQAGLVQLWFVLQLRICGYVIRPGLEMLILAHRQWLIFHFGAFYLR